MTTPRWAWTSDDGRSEYSAAVVKDRVEWAAWSREQPGSGGGATQGVDEFERDGPRAPWAVPEDIAAAVRAHIASGAWRGVAQVDRAEVDAGWEADPDDDRGGDTRCWVSVSIEDRVVTRREAGTDESRREVEQLVAAGWRVVAEHNFARSKRWEFERPWSPPADTVGSRR